ncbi:MAG: FG-GAP repeat domain-containing protein [Actinomycetota bacterium]
MTVRGGRTLVVLSAVLSLIVVLPPSASAYLPPPARYLIPAGDLNADGTEDALEHLFLYQYDDSGGKTRISGVDGVDGTTLWTIESGGYSDIRAMGDLDGVPGDDVLLEEQTSEPIPGGYQTTTIFRALRGADGGELWSRSYTGLYTLWVTVGSSEGSARLGSAYPADGAEDLNGDDTADLLVERHGAAYVYDGTADRFAESTIFEAVSGRTGQPIAVFSATGASSPGVSWVPDFTGDGLTDVAVVSFSPEPTGGSAGGTVSVSAYPGTGGPPKWQREVDVLGYAYYLHGADLDGDGFGDVLLESDAGKSRFDALSGVDGATMWALDRARWKGHELAGDADGDGGEDVFVFAFVRGGALPKWDAQLIGGSDGEAIWARALPSWPYTVGDATGDGVVDLVSTQPGARKGGAAPEKQRVARLLDGATGGLVWARRLGKQQDVYPLRGDLDGDGNADLAVVSSIPADYGVYPISYVPISGRSGRDLWTRAVVVEGGIRQLFVADLLPADGVDLLESGFAKSGARFLRFGVGRARAGATGAKLWRRVFDLASSPRAKRNSSY